MMTTISQRHKSFLSILSSKGLNISAACNAFGITRRTYYNWLEDPDFREQVMYIKEEIIDHVESHLLRSIENGNVTAMIFFLKTKGKDRGYVETTSIEHSTCFEHPTTIEDHYPNYSIEEMNKMVNEYIVSENLKIIK